MAKREVFISRSRSIGSEPMVTMSVVGSIDQDIHLELALFTPSIVAAANQMGCSAWYDDEEHSITIKRDMAAPPRRSL